MNNKINKIKKRYKKFKKIKNIEFKKRFDSSRQAIKKFIFFNWTWPKKVLLAILLIILIGSILLYLPISFNYEKYSYVNNEYHFVFNNDTIDKYLGNDNNVNYNFMDALFLSATAFTTTGISANIDVGTHLTVFGQFVILCLFSVGGFGYASLFYLLGKFIHKITKTQIFSNSFSHIERGGTKITDSPKMIVRIFFIIVIIQVLFGFIFSFIFVTTPFKMQAFSEEYYGLTIDTEFNYDCYGWKNYHIALWKGLFLSSSSINNTGLDLFGSTSLSIFRNDIGILVQVLTLILFIIGGIGFPIIYDLSIRFDYLYKKYFLYKICKKKEYSTIRKQKFSSFTNICLISSIVLIVISICMTFSIEGIMSRVDNGSSFYEIKDGIMRTNKIYNISIYNIQNHGTYKIINDQSQLESYSSNHFGINESLNKNFAIFFNTLSTRSAGFSTVSMFSMTELTRLIFIIFMFIGTAPSSTGGGIRITTMAVISKSFIGWLRGMDKAALFKRNIPRKNILNSYLIIFASISVIVIMSTITYLMASAKIYNQASNDLIEYSVIDYVFESVSAFGTCGLSVGLMSNDSISSWNRIPTIILMFIGQLGIGQTLEIFAKKLPTSNNPEYVEETIRIG